MKNIVSAAIMGVAMYFMYAFLLPYLGLFLDLFLTCIVGSAIYIGCMVLNGGVTKKTQPKCPLSDDFSRKNALSLRQRVFLAGFKFILYCRGRHVGQCQ